jgi:DNA-binding LacI/PurR family transcriptional regulator
MTTVAADPSAMKLLAKRIESEIRSRGLQAGDRFMTTDEVGQLLGVSSATAHRALNLLVKQKFLVRQHGRGTFIGAGVVQARRIAIPTIFILLPDDQRDVASVEIDVMVDAIRARVGRVNVCLGFLPEEDTVEYVRELITQAHEARQFAGAIPISCPREVYRYLSDVAAPTVVLGSLYRDQQHLPSIDVDHRQAGRLLTEHLVKHGHSRLALLATGGGRPGDDAFYDGVSDALTQARLPHNALVVRIFPHDFGAFRAQIDELLAAPDRPTGIICRSERMLGVVGAQVAAAGLTSPDDVEVVFQTQSCRGRPNAPHAHVRPEQSFKHIAEQAASMLERLREGESLIQDRVIIPVALQKPGNIDHGG